MSKEVNLAPLRIKPSKYLWFAQLLFGCLLIIASLLATFPLVIHNTQWLLIELAFVCAIFVWLVLCFKSFIQSTFELNVFSGEITIKKIMLDSNGDQSETPVRIKDEILVWPWVIIIHLESIQDDRKSFRFIVLQDSCSHEEWRQLRVYLLGCG